MPGTNYEVGSTNRFFPRKLSRGVTGVKTFSKGGELEERIGGGSIYRFPHIILLTEVFIAVGVAPTGSSIVVDVNKNGVSVFSGPKPTIPAGQHISEPISIAVLILPTDNIQVDIDDTGSNFPGENLTVELRYRTVR